MIKQVSKTVLILLIYLSSTTQSKACTIFVLCDENNTLFFNNEDYSNPNTRLWFVPASEESYGIAYVGFDNGWGQGGVNTEGLAFDWFAGGAVDYEPDENLIPSKQHLLEACATVDEAIDYYKTYIESSFRAATILIADKSGASVIIGARNGKIYFEKSEQNAAIGFGLRTFNDLNGREAEANLIDGTAILQQCVQKGENATKYSSVYDLRTGRITINQFLDEIESVDFNLFEELEKGGHYYDIPKIQQQIKEPIMPLLFNQYNWSLYDFDELPATVSINNKVKKIIQDFAIGNMKAEDYTLDLWDIFKLEEEDIKNELAPLGQINSLHLIKDEGENELKVYSYIIIFENARVLMQFTFNEDQKLSDLKTVKAELTNIEINANSPNTSDCRFSLASFKEYYKEAIVIFLLVLIGLIANRKANRKKED